MTRVIIRTTKRASGYQARYELPGLAPIRHTGHRTQVDAVQLAIAGIRRVMDARAPGMSSVTIAVV